MQHRIRETLNDQGRNMRWLARVTGYSHGYIRLIVCGADDASPEFRTKVAQALGVPEAELFFADDFDGRTHTPAVASQGLQDWTDSNEFVVSVVPARAKGTSQPPVIPGAYEV